VRKLPSRQANRRVVAWWRTIPEEDLFLPAPAIAELVKGVEMARAEGSEDGNAKATVLASWVRGLKTIYRDRIVRLDDDVLDEWGRLMAVHRGGIGAIDLLIAAMAIARGMTLATRDGDFQLIAAKTPVALVNPFEFPSEAH
jgi:predicted nucleic acid-binding protein